MKMTMKTSFSTLFCLLAAASSLSAKPVATLRGHEGDVQCVAYSPDGKLLASGSEDGNIKIWDTATNRELGQLQGHKLYVNGVAFSPDGALLASAGFDGTVRLWDVAGRTNLGMLGEEDGATQTGVAFSPDGKLLASASNVGLVTVWDVAGRVLKVKLTSDHGEASCVAFSPDGKSVTAGYEDGSAVIWDLASGRPAREIEGHVESVGGIAYSTDGKLLATGGDDRALRVWNATSGDLEHVNRSDSMILSVAFSPDGKQIACGQYGGTLTLYSLDSDEATVLLVESPDLDSITSVTYSPDGKRIAAASEDGTIKLLDPAKAAMSAQLRADAERQYRTLFDAARFLDRRKGLLADGFPAEALEVVLQKATKEAENEASTLKESLNQFVSTTRRDDFKAEKDPNFKGAQKARDALYRNLLVIKLVAEFAEKSSGDEETKATLIGNAFQAWETTSSSFMGYYPDLANAVASEDEKDEEGVRFYRQVRFIARRTVITTDELLRAAPDAAGLDKVREDIRDETRDAYWRQQVSLLGHNADYVEVLRICRMVAEKYKQPEVADNLAYAALQSFTVLPDFGGRSERARDAARSLKASDFGAFIKGLAELKELKRYRDAIPSTFAEFCTYHRPIEKTEIELALAPLAERTEEEMQLFVGALLKVLRDVNSPSPKGNEPAKKIDDENWAARISEEYEALDQVLTTWLKDRKSWRGNLMRSNVQYAWATHQLKVVEIGSDSGSGEDSDKKVTVADAEGYRTHIAEWKGLITSATSGFLDDPSLTSKPQQLAWESQSILTPWFEKVREIHSEPAYRKQEGEDLLGDIRRWVGQLPQEAREPVLTEFAMSQLSLLDPPIQDTGEAGSDDIKQEERFDFVEAVASLAPDTEGGRIFQGILDEFKALTGGVRFYAVPEGELYEKGAWADGALPAFPVDSKEFGVWFTLVHTEAAKRNSGGFRRYAKSSAAVVNPDEANSLSETERTNYANDFKNYLEAQLTESFEVVEVKPHSKPDAVRSFKLKDGEWLETPLYYAVLRPKGNAPPGEIPGLRLDLDFAHPLGRVILPFHSRQTPLQLEHGKVSHVRDLSMRQDLDDSHRDQGEMILTIISESTGLPPEPHRYSKDFPPEGFKIHETTSTISVLSFPTGSVTAQVRRETRYRLDWHGGGFATTFRFPTHATSAADTPKDWEITNFLQRQGQIKERKVTAGELSLYGLPWRWDFLSRWLSNALFWGCVLLGAVGVAFGIKWLSKRLKTVPAPRFPMSRPAASTPLAVANFLRRIAANDSIPLSSEQVDALHADVERLENFEVQDNEASTKEAGSVADKWLGIAQERFSAA